jgi:hypothetical protein
MLQRRHRYRPHIRPLARRAICRKLPQAASEPRWPRPCRRPLCALVALLALVLPAQASARTTLPLARAETAIKAAETRWWTPEPSLVEVTRCHRVSSTAVVCGVSAIIGWSTTCGLLVESGNDEAELQSGKVLVYLAAVPD